MLVNIYPAPWHSQSPSPELIEACNILGSDVWREAAIDYHALRSAKLKHGRSAPKGMQAELNRVIDSRFMHNHWNGNNGRFIKNETWVRVTFRHQMSLGSDILDAAKLCARENYKQAIIIAGESDWLQIVSPNDCKALVSFEKLRIAVSELNEVINTPLFIGSMRGKSELPKEIAFEIYKDRPRDLTIPSKR
jgi:hypothetical protein